VKKSVAFSVLATIALATFAGPAVEAKPVPKLTGGVALEGPPQYVQFNGIKDGAPDSGSVTYTNFDTVVTDTSVNVWSVVGTHEIDFQVDGDPPGSATVTIPIGSVVALSPTSSQFSGTWSTAPGPDDDADFLGVVSGAEVEWQLFDDGVLIGSSTSGTIDTTDGSVAGTGVLPDNVTGFVWSADAGTAHRVFHFTAPITCASINLSAKTAAVTYDVPNGDGFPYTGDVLFRVEDNGNPGTNDTYGHRPFVGSNCAASDAITDYNVIAGNLKVH
jgi:hypothetical protein